MMHFVIILSILCQTADGAQDKPATRQHYKTGIIISGLLSTGCLIGAGVCNSLANKAYERYARDVTFKRTAEDWNRVESYENTRDLFFAGAGLFLAATAYFQVKYMTSGKTSRYMPVLHIRYAEEKIGICVQKHL
jgi:hypothetical protein